MLANPIRDGAPDGDVFWHRFDARLRERPETATDRSARADLTETAWVAFSSAPSSGLAAEELADVSYRLRHGLGPTIAPDAIAEVKLGLETERERLLREGVSPELLG